MSAPRLMRPDHPRKCRCGECIRFRHAERLRFYRAATRKTDLPGDIDPARLEAYWQTVACAPQLVRWASTASSWGE